MIKLLQNNHLTVDSVEIAQGSADFRVDIDLPGHHTDCRYYLEAVCPKDIRFVSAPLEYVEGDRYTVLMPSTTFAHIGEVYVQLVGKSSADNSLMMRSLVGEQPLFDIKQSILADKSLETPERKDFFEYAEKVTSECRKVVEDIKDIDQNLEKSFDRKCEEIASHTRAELQALESEIAQTNSQNTQKIDTSVQKMNESISSMQEEISRENQELASHFDSLKSGLEGNVVDMILDVQNKVKNGELDGVSFSYEGEWREGATYHAGEGDSKSVSVVVVTQGGNSTAYICKIGGVATPQNSPNQGESWGILAGISPDVLAGLQRSTDNGLRTSSKSVVGAINELRNDKCTKKMDIISTGKYVIDIGEKERFNMMYGGYNGKFTLNCDGKKIVEALSPSNIIFSKREHFGGLTVVQANIIQSFQMKTDSSCQIIFEDMYGLMTMYS